MKQYPISLPYITREDRAAVADVLKTHFLSIGPKVIQFEKAFAKRIGTRYACAVSSGTAGLHLAMIAAGIGTGDEVITAPFTFIASANSILYVGAKPVFVDIDPTTFNIDAGSIEKKITARTKAILVVHIFGQPADMSRIMRIARKHKLKIIEDACESICATHLSKHVGTYGESAVFAFYPNKQMTTGEGGMLVTNNKRVYDACRSLRNQGRSNNMQWLDHKVLGYNYRMDEMSAALGLSQLGKLDFMIEKKQHIARMYTEYFKSHSDLVSVPRIAHGNTHTWFVYTIRFNTHGIDRDKVISELARVGVSTKPYLPSIHLFDFYKRKLGYKKGDFPISEQASNTSIALPFYIGLKKSDIKYIGEKVITILSKYA